MRQVVATPAPSLGHLAAKTTFQILRLCEARRPAIWQCTAIAAPITLGHREPEHMCRTSPRPRSSSRRLPPEKVLRLLIRKGVGLVVGLASPAVEHRWKLPFRPCAGVLFPREVEQIKERVRYRNRPDRACPVGPAEEFPARSKLSSTIFTSCPSIPGPQARQDDRFSAVLDICKRHPVPKPQVQEHTERIDPNPPRYLWFYLGQR